MRKTLALAGDAAADDDALRHNGVHFASLCLICLKGCAALTGPTMHCTHTHKDIHKRVRQAARERVSERVAIEPRHKHAMQCEWAEGRE